MKEIPCNNCLCFAICKSQAVRKNFQKTVCVLLFILDKKCELFSKWYRSSECFDKSKAEVTECYSTTSAVWLLWDEDFNADAKK